MDDIKGFVKSEKRIGNPNTGSKNIQSGLRDGIWYRKVRRTNNEKQETTHDGRNGTTKSRKKLERSEKRKRTNT